MDESSRESCQQREVLRGLESSVAEGLSYLLPIEKAWQPSDYLPNLVGEDWRAELDRLRGRRDGT